MGRIFFNLDQVIAGSDSARKAAAKVGDALNTVDDVRKRLAGDVAARYNISNELSSASKGLDKIRAGINTIYSSAENAANSYYKADSLLNGTADKINQELRK